MAQRRKRTGPAHISEVLEGVIRQSGIAEKMAAQAVLPLWEEVAGPRIAEHTQAVGVDGGILHVSVDSSVWLHRVRMDEADLKERLNREIAAHMPDRDRIQQIRFRLAETGTRPGSFS